MPGHAAPGAGPEVLTHRGDANQAAAAVIWPSGGGLASLRESRQLENRRIKTELGFRLRYPTVVDGLAAATSESPSA